MGIEDLYYEILGCKKGSRNCFSKTSKMPGYSFGLPTIACKTGKKLVENKNSTCAHCYARKGMYYHTTVKNSHQRRLDGLNNHLKSGMWEKAFIYALSHIDCGFFRWHDSGDIQSVEHLRAIVKIAEHYNSNKRRIMFWLPTKETKMVEKVMREMIIPDNLIIRVSSHFTNQKPYDFPNTHTEHTIAGKPVDGKECQAYLNEPNRCGSCRDCWDRDVKNISFLKH